MTVTATNHPLPNLQQLIHFIENEAYHLVRKETPEFRLIHQDGNTLHLSDSGSITLNQDGTLSMNGPIDHVRIHIRPNEEKNFFNVSWMCTYYDAQSKLMEHLTKMLQLTDTIYNDPHQPASKEKRRELLESKPVEKAVTKAARGIRSAVGRGYLHSPGKLGYGILHEFLGKDLVSRTLRIAGAHATLHHFNMIAHNPHAFEEAHRLNPNATVLFFQLPQYNSEDTPTPSAEEVRILSSEKIIEQARRHYTRCVNIDPGTPNDSWPTFCNLNHRAINTHPSRKPFVYASIAKLTQQAGAQPSYTAIKSFMRMKNIHNILDTLVTAFIRESNARTRNRKKSQRQLAAQMEKAVDLVNPEDNTQAHHPLFNTIQSLPANTPWNQVMENFPKTVQDATPPVKPRPRNKQAPTRETAKKTSTTIVRSIVNGPALGELKALLTNVLTLEADQDNVILRTKDSKEPVFQAKRLHNNTIHIDAPSYWHAGLDLPDPGILGTPDPSWTTRGHAVDTATRIAQRYLTENWETLAPEPDLPLPSHHRTSAAVEHLVSGLDEKLSLELADAIRSLIDTEIMEEARKFTPHVTLQSYNVTAAIGHQMDHLLSSNPGAVQWAIHRVIIDGPLNHPGQVITAARETMAQAGLHPGNWKFAATLDENTMRQLCLKTQDEEQGTLLLNAMAHTKSVPTQNMLDYALGNVSHLLTENNTGIRRDNALSMMNLMFKEDRDNPGFASTSIFNVQASNAADYVRNMNTEQQPVRATTWKGLLRASDRWHKTLRNARITQQWINLLEQQDNHYHAWDSALGTTELDEYTAVPLGSEYHLYQESLAMHHCVIGYGPQCAQGNSRIFSILKDGEPAATTEIKFVQGTSWGAWQETQTRGHYNAQVDGNILSAAEQLADFYNKAQKRPQRHRSSRYVNNVTKETADTRQEPVATEEYAVVR